VSHPFLSDFGRATADAKRALTERFPLESARDRLRRNGAWCGPGWFCRCRGRVHMEREGICGSCGLRRPGGATWFVQSAKYAALAQAERDARAVDYLNIACLTIAMRDGLNLLNAAFPHLFAQVARDFHMLPQDLAKAWGVSEADVPRWVELVPLVPREGGR